MENDTDSENDCTFYPNNSFVPMVIGTVSPNPLFEFNANPTGDFMDLPNRDSYLPHTKLRQDLCYSDVRALVTHKYSDHAIVYLTKPARRPAVIFRSCFANFDDYNLGKWLQVDVGLLDLPARHNSYYTNLYCTNIQFCAKPLYESEIKDETKVFITGAQVSFTGNTSFKRCDNGYILYSDFGSILIIDEYTLMFNNLRKGNFFIDGTLRSIIRYMGRNEYVCWMLCPTFNVFKNNTIHQQCVDGVFQKVPKVLRERKPKKVPLLQSQKERRHADWVASKAQEETPEPVVIPTAVFHSEKNIGEELADIFFNKRRGIR